MGKYFYAGNVRMDGEGIVCVIHHKSRRTFIWFFYIFLLEIIDFHFFAVPAFGVVTCQFSCLLKGAVGKFLPFCLYHHMGAGHAFCMEPPVVSRGKFKGQLIVLIIIFSHVHMESVRGNIVEGSAFYLCLFIPTPFFDIAEFYQFLLNLNQIVFRQGNI